MSGAQAINAYLNAEEPWKLLKVDLRRGAAVLVTALDAINGVRVGLAPFLPFSSSALDEILGAGRGWVRTAVETGIEIAKPKPLFAKVDLKSLLDDPAAGN